VFLPSDLQGAHHLQGATILSHFGSSLPEDRSLWPSYTSGGILPLPRHAQIAVLQNGSLPAVVTLAAPKTAEDKPQAASVPANPNGPRTRARSRSMSALVALRKSISGGRPSSVKIEEIDVERDTDDDDDDEPVVTRATFSPPPHAQLTLIRPGVLAHATSAPIAIVRKTPEDALRTLAHASVGTSSGSWSVPRSSLRGASDEDAGGIGTDEEPDEMDEDPVRAPSKEPEWDGMDLEMEM